MVRALLCFLLWSTVSIPLASPAASKPFVGRWDFNVPTRNGIGANWLGISEKSGTLEVWFQPTGGHFYQVKDCKQNGSHLTLIVAPAEGNHPQTVWELDAADGKLTGTQKRGASTVVL